MCVYVCEFLYVFIIRKWVCEWVDVLRRYEMYIVHMIGKEKT